MIKVMQGFDEFVNNVIKEWKVPGAAVAVVKDSEVVHSQGYGLRDVEKQLPVTPQTLFAIGSTTKAFTAAMAGILVDDGVLEWDKPICEYIPEFKMFDPFASANLTMRDMLCHRSGLPRHEFVWYHREISRKDLMKTLAYLEPNKSFRSRWEYQNIIYATTGYVMEAITGKTWEELVRERIFQPLGMTSTNFSVLDSQKSPDFSQPYQEKDEVVSQVPFAQIDTIGPAGSINSNLEDMSKWLLLNLSGGKVGEKQIISEANLKTIHRPQMVIVGEESPFADTDTDSLEDYGLAWGIYHYRGIPILEHSGGIDGFITEVALAPRQNLGVVAFVNANSMLPMVLYRSVLDRMLELEPIDWNDRYQKRVVKMKEMGKQAKEKSAGDRKPDTHPSHALEEYTGKYQHPAYGELEFRLEDGKLVTDFRGSPMELVHYHYDVFEGEFTLVDVSFKFTFEMDASGNIDRVSSPLEASVKPIVFTRVASDEMRQRSFLEPFVGEYELMGQTLKIFLKGENTLVASGPGMTDQELVPYRGTQFKLKGMEAVSLEFKVDSSEAAGEVVIVQPGATLTAKRKV